MCANILRTRIRMYMCACPSVFFCGRFVPPGFHLLPCVLPVNRNGESSLPVQPRAVRWPSKTPELFLAASLACSRVMPALRPHVFYIALPQTAQPYIASRLPSPPLPPFLEGCSFEGVRDWCCRPDRLLFALHDWKWRRVRQRPGVLCTTAVQFTLLPGYNGMKIWGSIGLNRLVNAGVMLRCVATWCH